MTPPPVMKSLTDSQSDSSRAESLIDSIKHRSLARSLVTMIKSIALLVLLAVIWLAIGASYPATASENLAPEIAHSQQDATRTSVDSSPMRSPPAEDPFSSRSASIAGHNAWMMTASAMILFMTSPGLALFYAGLVRKKNVLSVFMQCLFLTSVMTVVWCCYGYSLTFSTGGKFQAWIGGGDYLFLNGISRHWDEAKQSAITPMLRIEGHETPITMLTHMIFQGMYFVISPAIMCGAFAERMRFHGMILFSILWGTFVYCPIAHWVWGAGLLSYPSGLMGGSLDFAGGTVVHISSGVSALVAAIIVGPRLGFGKDPMPPHNLTYTAIGASMLWFGWFGFNAGSAMGSNETATSAFVTTQLAAASGAIGWWLIEWKLRGKPTLLGVSSGIVAGLVSITPSAGYVQPMSALIIGFTSGIICFYACSLCKHWAGYDDSLDAFGIHGAGGIIGALFTGVFATRACYSVGHGSKLGLFEGGNIFAGQLTAIAVVTLYSGLTTLILLKVIDWTVGLRVSASDERQGLDVQEHGEEGYIFL